MCHLIVNSKIFDASERSWLVVHMQKDPNILALYKLINSLNNQTL